MEDVKIEVGTEFGRQFKRLAKKYHSLINDLIEFKNSLKNDPFQGTDLRHGLRKIRFVIGSKNKGKSGGARVITFNVSENSGTLMITLLTIYDKSEISNVSDEYLKMLVDEL